MELVTGYSGKPHITAEQDAQLYAAHFNESEYVLEIGKQLAAEVVTANKVRLFDGSFMLQGRHCYIGPGEYDDFLIENGASSFKRHDLLVARYSKDVKSGIEKVTHVTVKGAPHATAPVDPKIAAGDIRAGATLHEMPLYRVTLDGLNLTKITPLFTMRQGVYASLNQVEQVAKDAKVDESVYFVDGREQPPSGYWHKIFTCKVNAFYTTTEINMKLAIQQMHYTSENTRDSGILNIGVRQLKDGTLGSKSSVKWESNIADLSNKLGHFAVNAVPAADGHYIEFYIYNNKQYAGYKTSVILKSARSTGHKLTFKPEINGESTSTLAALPTNGTIIYSTLGDYMARASDVVAAQATANAATVDEFAYFADNRTQATSGYWHKMFTCKVNDFNSTDINMRLAVQQLYTRSGDTKTDGVLNISIRQNTAGVLVPETSYVQWESAAKDVSGKLKHFAVNVVASSGGNYIEFYIFNDKQWNAYKVSVISKRARESTHALTFTPEVNGLATSTLTALPTNGTIFYSTLGEYMTLASHLKALESKIEEGTWTPSAQHVERYVEQRGRYIKIGTTVTVYFSLEFFTTSGASGGILISGLPFVAANTAGGGGWMSAEGNEFSAQLPNGFRVLGGGITIQPLRLHTSSGGLWGLDYKALQRHQFYGSVTYQQK